MSVKIKFNKKSYIKEETTKEGLLFSQKEYDNKYLPNVMQQLSKKAEPDNHEKLLKALRTCYKLFKPHSLEFVENQ